MMPLPPPPGLGAADSLSPGLAPVRTQPDGRPISTWTLGRTLAVILGAYVIGTIASIPVFLVFGDTRHNGSAGSSELLQTAVTDIVFVCVLIYWLSRRHREWRAAIGFPGKGRWLKEMAIGAGLGVVVLIAATVASSVILDIIHAFVGGNKQSLPDQVRPDLSVAGLVIFSFTALVVAPVTEEFVFRGLIFRTIRDRHRFIIAAVVSALLFGAVHFVAVNDWPSEIALMATMVITGLGLATIYERRGNLAASIAGHAAFNLIAVVTIASRAMH